MNIVKNNDGTLGTEVGEMLTLKLMASARVMFEELSKLTDMELLEIAKNAEGNKKTDVARKVIENILSNERPKIYDDAFQQMVSEILRHTTFEIDGISANIREQLNAKALGLSLSEYYDMSLAEASEKLLNLSKENDVEVTSEREEVVETCEPNEETL